MEPETTLLANGDDPGYENAARHGGTVVTYGFGPGVSLRAIDVQHGPAGCRFTLTQDGVRLGDVMSPMAGRHNVWNTLAAFGSAMALGVKFDDLAKALPGFLGTQRRQEEEVGGVLVMDDYAHHPTAIRETLAALRFKYPDRRIWGIYEPKSNTARRNIHQAAYATAFDSADRKPLAKPLRQERQPET